MGGVTRAANRAIGGDIPVPEMGTGYPPITPNIVYSAVAQMMSQPRDQWPDVKTWGPNSLNLLEQRYKEASSNDLNTAIKVATALRNNDNRLSLSDIKNPALAAIVEAAKISPTTSPADFLKLQRSLMDYQNQSSQKALHVIDESRVIFERSPTGQAYQRVTANDAARAAEDFAHKPSSQWPDISNWGPNSVLALRGDYHKMINSEVMDARQVLANNGKGIENIQNPALKAILEDVHPGMSQQERDKISNRLTEVQTLMNTTADSIFNNRMGEIRGMRAAADGPPSAPRPA